MGEGRIVKYQAGTSGAICEIRAGNSYHFVMENCEYCTFTMFQLLP